MIVFYILINICFPYHNVIIPIHIKTSDFICMFCFVVMISCPINSVCGSMSKCYILDISSTGVKKASTFYCSWITFGSFLLDWLFQGPMVSLAIRHFLELFHFWCRNLSLGLTTKARAYKVAGQEGISGVIFHALGSVGNYEGMNPHTPKGASTLGIRVSMDFSIFREQLKGTKLNGFKRSLYYWKSLGT